MSALRRWGGVGLPMALAATLCWDGAVAEDQTRQRIEVDIPFVDGGRNDQQLDLYRPAGSGFPTLLFVHEGGLTSGDRKDAPYSRMCETFQEMGIGCAAANYRLAPERKWPAQPDDVVAAFTWLKRNIAGRGGDPDRIFLFGHSSGGLLVAVVAADPRYLSRQGWKPSDVAGVIAMGCRLDDTVEVRSDPPAAYERSWVPADRIAELMKGEVAFTSLEQRNDAVPALHVSAELPPTLILIADAERFFPPVLRDAAEFVGRALAAGAEAELATLADRTHMSAIREMVSPTDPAVSRVAAFVRSH